MVGNAIAPPADGFDEQIGILPRNLGWSVREGALHTMGPEEPLEAFGQQVLPEPERQSGNDMVRRTDPVVLPSLVVYRLPQLILKTGTEQPNKRLVAIPMIPQSIYDSIVDCIATNDFSKMK